MMNQWTTWLARLMNDLDLNQNGLAVEAEVAPSTVSHWMAGTRPDGAQIIKLAGLAGIPPTKLFNIVWGLEAPAGETAPEDEQGGAELLRLFHNLSDDERKAEIATLKLRMRLKRQSGSYDGKRVQAS